MSTNEPFITLFGTGSMFLLDFTVSTFPHAFMTASQWLFAICRTLNRRDILWAFPFDYMPAIKKLINSFFATWGTADIWTSLFAQVSTLKHLFTFSKALQSVIVSITFNSDCVTTRLHDSINHLPAVFILAMTIFALEALLVACMATRFRPCTWLLTLVSIMSSWIILRFGERMADFLTLVSAFHSCVTLFIATTLRDLREVVDCLHLSYHIMILTC